jgi:hypothetical protein
MREVAKPKLGRPTLYEERFAQALIDYFDVNPYEEKTKTIITQRGDAIEVPFNEATDFKSLAGFAINIGVHRDTLHEWASATNPDGTLKHPEFSDAYKRAKDYQENYIAINGNKGLIPAAFGIFTAKNVLHWRDKQPGEEDKVIVNNVNNFKNMTDEELDRKLAEFEATASQSEPTEE